MRPVGVGGQELADQVAVTGVDLHAIESGDLPRSTDPEMIVDFVFGAIWFNLLLGDANLTSKHAHRIVKMIELLGAKQAP